MVIILEDNENIANHRYITEFERELAVQENDVVFRALAQLNSLTERGYE